MSLEKLYLKYKDQVEFFLVYVREAHPADGKVAPANELEGIAFEQPKDLVARQGMATKCTAALKLSLPTLIDTMEGVAERAYSAMPDRFCVIGIDGKVAFLGAPGPAGFKVSEAETALAELVGPGAILPEEGGTPEAGK